MAGHIVDNLVEIAPQSHPQTGHITLAEVLRHSYNLNILMAPIIGRH